jgi:hypothetical protein
MSSFQRNKEEITRDSLTPSVLLEMDQMDLEAYGKEQLQVCLEPWLLPLVYLPVMKQQKSSVQRHFQVNKIYLG